MNKQFSHDVFISFSFENRDVAEEIVNVLTSEYGFSCWICTRDISGGEKYKGLIPDAIRASKVVVFIQSEPALASVEIPKEIGIAFDSRKMIIPFKIDDSVLHGDVEYDLYNVEYIDATVKPMEARIADLARSISNAINKPVLGEKSGPSSEKLLSTPAVLPKNVFKGRTDILQSIADEFQTGEHVVFLQGIGGIGKTEIAKQYVKAYREKYDTVVFATYAGSLTELINAETPFEFNTEFPRLIKSDGTAEEDIVYFKRKLKKIQKVSDERTLVVIDNFDVESDEMLGEVAKGRYHLLVTTRNDYSRFFKTIKVGNIESMDHLIELFMENYQGFTVERDDPKLVELIELVNRHTYTIELLAQHMENSGQSAAEMIESLSNNGIMSLNEEIRADISGTNLAYENLLKMFHVFGLSEEEKKMLCVISMMPLTGVMAGDLKEWTQITSFKILKDLEAKSWIARIPGGVAMHPIIQSVVRVELTLPKQELKEFLERFVETILEKNAWHFTLAIKEKYAAIAAELLNCFPDINEDTLRLYEVSEALFSFSVKPQLATELAERIFEYRKEKAGELSFETARAAFKIGWAYLYNLQLENALDKAKPWLELANDIFEKLELNSVDEIACYTQLLGNLSRVNLLQFNTTCDNSLLDVAKGYVMKAIELNAKWITSDSFYYPRIAGGYMHLADLYVVMGEYEEAYRLSEDSYDILEPLFGDEDMDTLHAISRKVIALYHLKKYEEALDLGLTAVEKYDIVAGEFHLGRFDIIIIVLKCHIALGNMEKAKAMQADALRIGKKIFVHGSKKLEEIKELI